MRERDSNPRRSFKPCQLMRLVRYQLLYPAIYFVAHNGNAPPFPVYTYGVLTYRPMRQFCGDVRVRTGVCTNVYTILLSDCVGFEVLGTSTNCHKGSRLHIRRPIDTGKISWLIQRPLPGSISA